MHSSSAAPSDLWPDRGDAWHNQANRRKKHVAPPSAAGIEQTRFQSRAACAPCVSERPGRGKRHGHDTSIISDAGQLGALGTPPSRSCSRPPTRTPTPQGARLRLGCAAHRPAPAHFGIGQRRTRTCPLAELLTQHGGEYQWPLDRRPRPGTAWIAWARDERRRRARLGSRGSRL